MENVKVVKKGKVMEVESKIIETPVATTAIVETPKTFILSNTDTIILQAVAEGAKIDFAKVNLSGVTSLADAKARVLASVQKAPVSYGKPVESRTGFLISKFMAENKRFPTCDEARDTCKMSKEAFEKKSSSGDFYREVFLGMAAGLLDIPKEEVQRVEAQYIANKMS